MWPFKSREPARPSFAFGDFQLGQLVWNSDDLKELSAEGYSARPKTFVGERIFIAPPVRIADHPWMAKVATVDGEIYKLAAYQELQDKVKATRAASAALSYCVGELGEPTRARSGLFEWQTSDGNVILQTAEAADGFAVNIFATSSAVRGYRLL